jgi:hypothetical protein
MSRDMRIDVHHHIEGDARILQKLDDVLSALATLRRMETQTMAGLQALKDQADKVMAAVTAESDKDDAIIALVNGNTAMIASLKQQLADALAANDPAAIQGVLDSLTAAETSSLANAQKVVDAINANTPTP